jgi:V8-like Glu-specific endopeptidase
VLNIHWPKPLPTPPDVYVDFGERNALEILQQYVEARGALQSEIDLLDQKIKLIARSFCVNNLKDVEDYTPGPVPKAFVDAHQPPVAQLRWLDLTGAFKGHDKPGNVSSRKWGTGALISDNLLLTAGHCFDAMAGNWVWPSRNGTVITPEDAAANCMNVVFNYQYVAGTAGTKQPQYEVERAFPILALPEHSLLYDYAILELGRDASNQLPGQVYGHLTPARSDLTTPGATLCIIQHPDQKPKMVATGPLAWNASGDMAYQNLDTADGSSGAPILSGTGELVGVHVQGACSTIQFNHGVPIGLLRYASSILKQLYPGAMS